MAEIVLTGKGFACLVKLSTKLAEKLFIDYFAGEITDHMKCWKLDSAQRRVVDQLLSTLEPIFATHLKEDHAEFLISELTTTVEHTDFNPKVFAEHAYNPEKVLKWCLETGPPHPDIETLELDSVYTEILRQAIIRLNDLAPMLPDWERANWEQTFARLERIEEGQRRQTDLITELQQAPDKKTQTFEEHYRRYITNEHGKIEMRGIRGVAEVLSLPLEVAFLELKLANRPGEKSMLVEELVDMETTQEVEGLADLETAREQIKSLRKSFHVAEERKICEILASAPRVVIVGDPGSGKSTLLQYIAYRTARRELSKMHSDLPDDLVPFLFTVRSLDFSDLPTPRDFMARCARHLDTEGSATFVEETLIKGRALILLDGLDECEVPPDDAMKKPRRPGELTQWDRVVEWVKEFLKTYPESRFVVSSRPSGYTTGLLEEKGFAEAKLLPLGERDREAFVCNWYSAAERSKGQRDEAAAAADAEARASDLRGRIEKTPSVQLLASTPLMLSVLCVIHQYRGDRLPERRVELLRECVDVLLYEWRASHGLDKSVIGDLDAVQQRALLEPLAWAMLQERKAEFPRGRVDTIFQEHLPEIRQPKERSTEVLATIRDRTGVLIERRPGVFAFAHVILQEYLAAEEAARRGLDPLLSHAEDAAWQEVIPLAVGVAKGSQETFIRSLLQKNHVPLAGRCVAAAERLDPALSRKVVCKLGPLLGGPNTSDVEQVLLEIGGETAARECVRVIANERLMSYKEKCLTFAADRGVLTANLVVDFAAVNLATVGAGRALSVTDLVASLPANPAADVAALAIDLVVNPGSVKRLIFTTDQVANLIEEVLAFLVDRITCFADLSATLGTNRAADLLGRFGDSAFGPLSAFLSRPGVCAEHRLVALWPFVELLNPSNAEEFFNQIELVPRTDYPLLQLAIFARFRHRLGEGLTPQQQLRLTVCLQAAYRELGRHYIRFAKAVDAALRERKKPGISDNWEEYEAEFMQRYTAELDEKQPPGWGEKQFKADRETVTTLLSAGEPDYDTFRSMMETNYDQLSRILSSLLDSEDQTIRERAGQVLLKVFFNSLGGN